MFPLTLSIPFHAILSRDKLQHQPYLCVRILDFELDELGLGLGLGLENEEMVTMMGLRSTILRCACGGD